MSWRPLSKRASAASSFFCQPNANPDVSAHKFRPAQLCSNILSARARGSRVQEGILHVSTHTQTESSLPCTAYDAQLAGPYTAGNCYNTTRRPLEMNYCARTRDHFGQSTPDGRRRVRVCRCGQRRCELRWKLATPSSHCLSVCRLRRGAAAAAATPRIMADVYACGNYAHTHAHTTHTLRSQRFVKSKRKRRVVVVRRVEDELHVC